MLLSSDSDAEASLSSYPLSPRAPSRSVPSALAFRALSRLRLRGTLHGVEEGLNEGGSRHQQKAILPPMHLCTIPGCRT